MKVKKLIEVLKKVENKKTAEIEFYIDGDDNTRYDVKNINVFEIHSDVVFTLKELKEKK